MGEFKKNRFEPSHALALALHPSEVKQNVNLSANAPETAAYLACLAQLNRVIAAQADRVYEVVCGIPVCWKGE